MHIPRTLLVRVVRVQTDTAAERPDEDVVLRETRDPGIRAAIPDTAPLRPGQVICRRLAPLRALLGEGELFQHVSVVVQFTVPASGWWATMIHAGGGRKGGHMHGSAPRERECVCVCVRVSERE